MQSAPGHRGPVVGPGQLSPIRVAQATLLQQICWEAYLQVFMLKQTAHRCRDIYSTGSICFTNTDKKCLVWQQYLAGNFGFALHILLYWASLPSDPSVGKAGTHAELWFVPLLPCGGDGSPFFFLFLYWQCFFCFLSFSFPSFSGEGKNVLLHRDQCGLLILSSMFWISCGGGEGADLWLEVWPSGLPESWFAWKPCSLALASVVSVV